MHNTAVISTSVIHHTVLTGHDSNSGTTGWSSIIGIVTAIIGNILISFALNTQRYAHVRLEKEHNEKRGLALNKQNLGDATSTDQEPNPQPNGHDASNADHDEDGFRQLQESFRSDDTISPGDNDNDNDSDDGRESYLKSPIWWTGIILMTVGETGNFLAYGFAPASIVSPLGVVALISNCLIAPLMLKERFRQRDFWGVIVAIAGAVTVVLSAKQSESKVNPDQLWQRYVNRWEFLVYVILTVVAIIGLTIASPKYGRRTILVDIGLVGLYGGYTALSTKGVASLLSTELWKAFAFPIFYVLVLILVGSAIMQIRYLNKALQNFDSTQVIPTQFVMFTLSVIIGSAVLYRDFESTTPDRAIKFVAGCLLTFFGVYLITSKRAPPEGEKEDYEQDETTPLLEEEAEEIDERTPLTRDAIRRRSTLKETPQLATHRQSLPQTPPRSLSQQAEAPSIAVTPATDSPSDPNPWDLSTDSLAHSSQPLPRTPVRSQSDLTGTPFFTPGTSQPLHRSSTHEPGTPTRPSRTASPPKPDRAAVLAAEADAPSNLRTSARNSISRFIPGPLLPPLSSSLSGIVADSLRRGEGSPLSVRQRLRRSRLRGGAAGRRRSVAPGDEESGFTASDESLSFTPAPLPPGLDRDPSAAGSSQAQDAAKDKEDKKKSRLRSMSETFGSFLAGGGGGGGSGGSSKENQPGKAKEQQGGGNG